MCIYASRLIARLTKPTRLSVKDKCVKLNMMLGYIRIQLNIYASRLIIRLTQPTSCLMCEVKYVKIICNEGTSTNVGLRRNLILCIYARY